MKKINLSSKQGIIFYPILALVIVTLLLYLPSMVGYPKLELSIYENTTILLTFALAIFGMIQGYSAFIQVEMQGKTNRIENARNELEKAYGQIFTILNGIPEKDEKVIRINTGEKLQLDLLISTYPFMFPQNIIDYWKTKIFVLKPTMGIEGQKYSHTSSWATSINFVDMYDIPLEFVALFNDEYKKRINQLNDLLQSK